MSVEEVMLWTCIYKTNLCDKFPIAIDLLIDLNNLTQKRFLSNPQNKNDVN
jgi:hypothetical protein